MYVDIENSYSSSGLQGKWPQDIAKRLQPQFLSGLDFLLWTMVLHPCTHPASEQQRVANLEHEGRTPVVAQGPLGGNSETYHEFFLTRQENLGVCLRVSDMSFLPPALSTR